jgi:hypothetical protein
MESAGEDIAGSEEQDGRLVLGAPAVYFRKINVRSQHGFKIGKPRPQTLGCKREQVFEQRGRRADIVLRNHAGVYQFQGLHGRTVEELFLGTLSRKVLP